MENRIAFHSERQKKRRSASSVNKSPPLTSFLPPYSPDLNPLDFFVWGYLKSLVYETLVDLAEDLVSKIAVDADKIKTP